MQELSYITSNADKAAHMSRLLGSPIEPVAIEIPEIQSVDLQEVIEHKTKSAFELLKKPLFIDDVALVITAMNKLPGPFIKYFIQEIGNERICQIVDMFGSREAVAQAIIGYHDGTDMHFFEGKVKGTIADKPSGNKGFGWDNIFIPDGHTKIRSEMNNEEYDLTSPRAIAFTKLKQHLQIH